MVRRPSVVRRRRRSQCSKIFFSETAGPIKAKFYVEPPWIGGTKVCSRDPGHMTKKAQGQLLEGVECHIYLYCFTFDDINLNRAFVIIVLFPKK